jgi:hypothetical protein
MYRRSTKPLATPELPGIVEPAEAEIVEVCKLRMLNVWATRWVAMESPAAAYNFLRSLNALHSTMRETMRELCAPGLQEWCAAVGEYMIATAEVLMAVNEGKWMSITDSMDLDDEYVKAALSDK